MPTDAQALIKAAEFLQLDMTELEQRCGIHIDILRQQGWVSARKNRCLFMAIARQVGACDYPIRMGQAFSPDSLGPLGLLVVLSNTLQEAFEYLQSFYALQDNNLDIAVFSRGENSLIQLKFHASLPYYLRTAMGATLIVRLISLIRWALGQQFRPHRVCLQRAMPIIGLEQKLGLECLYGSATDTIVMSSRDMQTPMQLAGGGVTDKVRETLLSHLRDATELITPLRELVLKNIRHPDYTLEDAASCLNISARTLQRRLKTMQTSFSKLQGQLRMDTALELLDQKALPVSEVALRIGYSDESAFSRAMVGKYGISPAQYRHNSSCRNSPLSGL